ncbi:unnamed protein product [Closterium sp. NIES-64]|nr:unnamed protein product [Closterium sp. NIES-64]
MRPLSVAGVVAIASPARRLRSTRRLHFPPVAPTPPPLRCLHFPLPSPSLPPLVAFTSPPPVAFTSPPECSPSLPPISSPSLPPRSVRLHFPPSRRLHFPPSRRLHFPPSRRLLFPPSRRLLFPFPSPSLPLPVAFTFPSRRLHFPFPSPSLPLPVAFSSPSRRLLFPFPSPSLPLPVAFSSPSRRLLFPLPRSPLLNLFPSAHSLPPCSLSLTRLTLSPPPPLPPLSFPLLTRFPPPQSLSPAHSGSDDDVERGGREGRSTVGGRGRRWEEAWLIRGEAWEKVGGSVSDDGWERKRQWGKARATVKVVTGGGAWATME